jgi:uncharacterized PurR-regulated membrane protein YhhQ (DUF165 family)
MRVGVIAALLFVGTVFAANWAIQEFGPVWVWPGLVAPAGVYFVGLAFTLRDIVHSSLGRWAVVGCILVGAASSYLIAPSFALASGVAFLASETADLSVYEPLRKRGWLPAVVASNIVGAIVDSVLFLWLAFGSLAFLEGQVVGKLWMTAVAVAVIAFARRRKVALA